MEEQTLKDKTAKGLFWGGVSNGVQQLLNLLFGIFLARLLTREDYGMVGVLSIFSLLATALQESGFTAALANRKEIKHEDYNAVFWFSVLTGLTLYAILFTCAPFIALFFKTPELTPLARYSFLGFLISSTGIAHSAYLFRSLMVKQRTMASVVGLILSGITGIILAWNGYAYWGIATQSLVYIATTTGCYWYFSPWRPTLPIHFAPLKQMFPFSSKLLVTSLCQHLHNQLFAVVLGKFYSVPDVGSFNQANKWNSMGHSMVNGMVSSVAQPVLAQVAHEKERQLHVFRRMMRFTSFVSFPAMFGLSLVAPEFITIAITDRWAESASMLQILCIGGAFVPIGNLCSNLLVSKGKSDIFMWNTITLVAVQLMTVLAVHPYGINCMITAYVAVNIGWLGVWHYFIHRETEYELRHFIRDVTPCLTIAATVMLITHVCTSSCTDIYLRFVAKVSMAASLYFLIMWAGGSETFRESLSFILKSKQH